MKAKWTIVVAFAILMIAGGIWVGSGGPYDLINGTWDASRQALDDAADRAAIVCAIIAGLCAIIGLLVLRLLRRIEKKLGDWK